jgi:hypothetical protein
MARCGTANAASIGNRGVIYFRPEVIARVAAKAADKRRRMIERAFDGHYIRLAGTVRLTAAFAASHMAFALASS